MQNELQNKNHIEQKCLIQPGVNFNNTFRSKTKFTSVAIVFESENNS